MADHTDRLEGKDEDAYWRTNYRGRPYASSGAHDYDFYRPGYRYGYDAAYRYEGRNWNDVESDLSTNWNTHEHRGTSKWEQVKAAVRAAWDRVTGRRAVGARR